MKQEQNLNTNKTTRDFRIYVMCGIPGSGKSTWCERNLIEKPIVSRDDIRFNLIDEGEEYFGKETEVFSLFVKSAVEACYSFGSAVLDATHISKGSRKKLFEALDEHLKGQYDTVIIQINTPLATCLKRNKMRNGLALVPEEAIYRMASSFTYPSYNEHDSIVEIWQIGGKLF